MPVPEWTIVDFIHRGPWWKDRGMFSTVSSLYIILVADTAASGIRLLNIYLFLPLLTAPINGFDSSLVNGIYHLFPGSVRLSMLVQAYKFFPPGKNTSTIPMVEHWVRNTKCGLQTLVA
jgi:hypothetical protein